jgi:hypothetical protein
MGWYKTLTLIALLFGTASIIMHIILTGFPNTFTRLNEHIQSEAMIAVRNDSSLTTLNSRTYSNEWTNMAIPSSTITVTVNSGPVQFQLDTGSRFVYKRWIQSDGNDYIEAFFMVKMDLRGPAYTNVTSLRLDVRLPVPVKANNETPLLGQCTINKVDINEQRMFSYTYSAGVCQNLTCLFTIPTTTFNSDNLEFKGHLLYNV